MIQPSVSVIIVNYNGKRYLKNCLDSLMQGSYRNIEIILVDNGSEDASPKFIRDNFPKVILVDNGQNLGLSIASNKGAKLASGKYLFFYNNDTVADRCLVENLVRACEKDERIGIAGCSTYSYDGKRLINAGVACDIFGYPYAKGRPFYVDAAIFVRKNVFAELGGFDEKMFLYGEDRDICWRCWLLGYKVEVVKDAVFFHDSACISADLCGYSTNVRKRYMSEYNYLRSLLKNYSLLFLLMILPFYFAINLAEFLFFSLTGKAEIAKGVYLKSYLDNFRDRGEILTLRRKIQARRNTGDFKIFSMMDKISGKLRLLFKAGIPRFTGSTKYGLG